MHLTMRFDFCDAVLNLCIAIPCLLEQILETLLILNIFKAIILFKNQGLSKSR